MNRDGKTFDACANCHKMIYKWKTPVPLYENAGWFHDDQWTNFCHPGGASRLRATPGGTLIEEDPW